MEKRVLIARWLGSDTQAIPIYDEASVSTARQRVRELGEQLNLSKELVESVALIASEVTHNQLSHAKHGYFAVKPIECDNVKGLEAIAADIGPGIKKPSVAIQDEYSSARTLGAGLERFAELPMKSRSTIGSMKDSASLRASSKSRRSPDAARGRSWAVPFPAK